MTGVSQDMLYMSNKTQNTKPKHLSTLKRHKDMQKLRKSRDHVAIMSMSCRRVAT